MEALNLTRGPSMHWEVVGVKQYNPTLPTLLSTVKSQGLLSVDSLPPA